MISIHYTHLKLSLAALQHFTVSSCQWGIFPLAFIIFQIFHSSEIRCEPSNEKRHTDPSSILFIFTISLTLRHTFSSPSMVASHKPVGSYG